MSEEMKMGAVGARMDKDFVSETGGKFRGKKRRKVSYLTINKIETVDYKDVNLLRKFISDRGKMLPCRQTGNTAKQQRMISRSIRRARELALLPFVVMEMSADRREFTPRRAPREHHSGPPSERHEGRNRENQPAEAAAVETAVAEAPVAEAPVAEAPAADAPATE